MSIRKKDMDTLRLKEDDGFVWQRLRRDYNFAIGDANGQTMTPYIFTALSYFNGLFFGTTHADNQLYGVILSPNGRFVIDANRHYDKIILDTISSRFYVAKQGQYGICDMTGRVIVEPVYEEILDTDTYYMVLQNNHWGCIEKDGTIVFPPRYDNFEKMENGYRIFLDGQEGWLDLSGKEHWSEK
ncbi:MAG: WG repeat-containing protein [Bacteroidales bacterium]|nr:WG repeat-containing protein [Bacteroidales bacterium]